LADSCIRIRKQTAEIRRAVLAPAIRMKNHPRSRAAIQLRHEKRLLDDQRAQIASERRRRGRYFYSRRMGTVEPVFANIRSTLGLDRFTLRSKKKVDIQWKLFCIVHNIGKIARYAGRGTGN
jgi:hypothetical protein